MNTHQTTKRGADAKGPGRGDGALAHAARLAALLGRNESASELAIRIDGTGGEPWLSIRAFRLLSVRTTTAPAQSTFRSSGSTQSVRAHHAFSQLALGAYAANSALGFEAFLLRAGLSRGVPVISLVPPTSVWPDSSLAAMIAFFAQEGFDVRYVDPAEGREAARAAIAAAPGPDAVVFGTSLHHVQLARAKKSAAQNNAAQSAWLKERLIVVDTGGTKGRTETLTRQEMESVFVSAYGALARSLRAGSEYGMCELASQAWSETLPHTSRFLCNDSLRVIAVERVFGSEMCGSPAARAPLTGWRALPPGQEGFLAFEDTLNNESYARIVTEDRGIAHDDCTFTLCARAPDASVKGCSLNVRGTFLFPSPSAKNGSPFSEHDAPRAETTRPSGKSLSAFSVSGALDDLRAAGVSEGMRSDLAFALEDLARALPELSARRALVLPSRSPLCIVASANVPVVFLYPLAWAWAHGVSHVEVKLPSLRAEDPIAAQMRAAMLTLLETLDSAFPGMRISVSDRIGSQARNQARFVVFGTNETVETFEALHPGCVEGLGSFLNAANAESLAREQGKDTALEGHALLAAATQALCRYLGRGCLTPVALFAPPTFEAAALARGLGAVLCARFAEEGAPALARILHRHDTLEIRYTLARLRALTFFVHEEPGACVIDLRALPADFPWGELPFGFGGAGLVYLLPENARAAAARHAGLAIHPTNPGVFDSHQGMGWDERIARVLTLPI